MQATGSARPSGPGPGSRRLKEPLPTELILLFDVLLHLGPAGAGSEEVLLLTFLLD